MQVFMQVTTIKKDKSFTCHIGVTYISPICPVKFLPCPLHVTNLSLIWPMDVACFMPPWYVLHILCNIKHLLPSATDMASVVNLVLACDKH